VDNAVLNGKQLERLARKIAENKFSEKTTAEKNITEKKEAKS
jgi:hypothetical protein